jgi:RimJ/RimL family protein N-acetyltransferase
LGDWAIIPIPTGTSDRLRFEPLVARHAATLSDALLDPVVYQFIEGPNPTRMQDLADKFEYVSTMSLVGLRCWDIGVFALNTGEGLGRIEANIVEQRAEIAYLFGSKHWGHGYAQEAMHWLQQRLREDGVASVLWATVNPQNERSIRLLTRLGFTPVADGWPKLFTYDAGNLVFRRDLLDS